MKYATTLLMTLSSCPKLPSCFVSKSFCKMVYECLKKRNSISQSLPFEFPLTSTWQLKIVYLHNMAILEAIREFKLETLKLSIIILWILHFFFRVPYSCDDVNTVEASLLVNGIQKKKILFFFSPGKVYDL